MRSNKKKGGVKIFVIILILLIAVAGVLLAMKILGDNNIKTVNSDNIVSNVENVNETVTEPEVVKTPETLSGTSRPIAFMIDNNINAMPQAGLEQANIVYELMVEGGETRLMLILQDNKDLKKIGPLRSSRHDFLDYALENDAIYVHYGWSPQAKGVMEFHK